MRKLGNMRKALFLYSLFFVNYFFMNKSTSGNNTSILLMFFRKLRFYWTSRYTVGIVTSSNTFFYCRSRSYSVTLLTWPQGLHITDS